VHYGCGIPEYDNNILSVCNSGSSSSSIAANSQPPGVCAATIYVHYCRPALQGLYHSHSNVYTCSVHVFDCVATLCIQHMVDIIQNGCKSERFYRQDCPHGTKEHIVGSTCVLYFIIGPIGKGVGERAQKFKIWSSMQFLGSQRGRYTVHRRYSATLN